MFIQFLQFFLSINRFKEYLSDVSGLDYAAKVTHVCDYLEGWNCKTDSFILAFDIVADFLNQIPFVSCSQLS